MYLLRIPDTAYCVQKHGENAPSQIMNTLSGLPIPNHRIAKAAMLEEE
jgi:hypothetical protein